MSRLSQGEREAFDPLFRALYPRAMRLARRRLTEDQATDAAQVVMMKVFSRASDFEAGKPVLPWFYAVAANELRTFDRRHASLGARRADQKLEHLASESRDPERLVLDQELRVCVDRAIASLDESSAEAIRCLLEDRPIPELSAAAFRKRVSRAYAKLRQLLGGIHAR
jgi:RNA polymerase sigma factor (sigma-70 family)